MRSCTCTHCGANLDFDDKNRDFIFCQYCGTKIMLDDYRSTYRYVDAAKVKQAETEQIIKLRQLEIAEKDKEDAKKILNIKIKISFILALIGILMLIIGFLGGSASGNSDSGFYMLSMVGLFPLMGVAYIWLFSDNRSKEIPSMNGNIKVPTAIEDFEKKNYITIEEILKAAGFVNIRCIALNDLTMGVIKKPGMVESITINGNEIESGGEIFPKESMVVISYHSFSHR